MILKQGTRNPDEIKPRRHSRWMPRREPAPLRRVLVVWACAVLFASFAPSTARAADASAPPRRNIVFILTDDQRFNSLGCLGHPFLQTPNLDALAKNGVLFGNAFVTLALYSPSRASILSGQYPHKHGVLDNVTKLPDDTPIFPIELQKGGYRTALIGKWHMGGDSDEPRPGFDRWVSFRGQGVYLNPTFNVDGGKTPREGYVTDLITDYAVDFIKNTAQHSGGKPFFLYVAHSVCA